MSYSLNCEPIGAFLEKLPSTDEHLTINFSPGFAPRKQRWRNYGLSADFLGDYFATFFPGDELPEDKIGKPETIKGSVSYIANELLENAMKYNEESAKFPVSISLYLYDEKLVFLVSNYTDQASGQAYSDYVKKLLTSDIDELYGEHLERAATSNGISQMGLLTILNDYGATLGLKVDPVDASDLYRVTTMVLLPV